MAAYSTPDPAAYRRAAAVLRMRADVLGSHANRVLHQVESTVFVGPAATRLRNEAVREKQTVMRAAAELQALADSLARAASHYEAQLAAGGL